MASLGRKPAPPVLLPIIWDEEVEVIASWLKERSGAQRRPKQTARVYVLMAKLHLDGRRPWPTRQQVSDHAGVSLPMIDKILTKGQALREITVSTAIREGGIAKHKSVTTERFIEPSQELIDLVNQARNGNKIGKPSRRVCQISQISQ